MKRISILVGILAVVLLSTGALLFLVLQKDLEPLNVQQDATNTSENILNSDGGVTDQIPTRWAGLIGTPDGLLSVYPENGDVGQSSHFLPPGVPLDFFQSLTDYDDRARENFMQLLEDGRLIFKGHPNIASAPKQNTLYIWPLKSSEAPKPFFQTQENLRIYFFALSEDMSKVAIISSRLSDDEIRSGDIPQATSAEEFFRLIEESEEELRKISIYNINSKELVSTIQLDESNQIRTTSLMWGTDTLVVVSNELGVYNPETGQKVLSLNPPTSAPLLYSISISPNGDRYYNSYTRETRHIRSNQLLSRLSALELASDRSIDPNGNLDQQIGFLGPSTFSTDSSKILVQAGSVSFRNFMVWELDVENDSTKKIGDLSTLIPVQNKPSVGSEAYTFNFLVYHPFGQEALFALYQTPPNRVGSTDVFLVNLESQEAQHLAGPFSAGNLRAISFIGWYREKIE